MLITSYDDLTTSITEILKIRSKNFVNTNCNIDVLIDYVYQEIAMDVPLSWKIQDITIEEIV